MFKKLAKGWLAPRRELPNTLHEDDMFKTLATLYQHIGHEISKTLPDDWQTAWVQVEMEEKSWSVDCFYSVVDSSVEPCYTELPNSVNTAFRRLRQVASTTGEWTTATFILKRDGAFTIEYGYDPVPIEQIYERRLAWKQKYLS